MMEAYIPKEKFSRWVSRLMANYPVIAPVRQGHDVEFSVLEKADDLVIDFRNTRLSAKGFFEPQSERMFEFSVRPGDPQVHILREVAKDFSSRIILGIRPCDARALKLVDVNFDTKTYRDPWWVNRRRNTILIGLACNEPCPTCFCTSVGGGPFDETGLDILMVDLAEGYALTACSDRGRSLVVKTGIEDKITGHNKNKLNRIRNDAQALIPKIFNVEPLVVNDLKELFESAFWEEIQFACLNCGICTYLCPTCWCFDIQDEMYKDHGIRLRNWDSCMFPLFTVHGSGHNPRQDKLQRVRQRFMHKFKYYVDKYHNGPACVGCGRCIQYCPVNIDIRQVVSLMTAQCVCS